MSDIVERLRAYGSDEMSVLVVSDADEAADCIVTLRTQIDFLDGEIERLRHDLKVYEDRCKRRGCYVATDENERVLVWRPIDTAPKDGTMVLLHRSDGVVLVGAFNRRAGVWVHVKDPTPTHWMPLPEPPGS